MNYITKEYYDFNGETSLSYTYAMCMDIKYIKQIEEGKLKSFSEIYLNSDNKELNIEDVREMIKYIIGL